MIEQLHDFFIMVGGGAAALTGLVFVALSLNLEIIVKDLTHRNRAIGTLVLHSPKIPTKLIKST